MPKVVAGGRASGQIEDDKAVNPAAATSDLNAKRRWGEGFGSPAPAAVAPEEIQVAVPPVVSWAG